MKRFLICGLLSICLLAGLAPGGAFAAKFPDKPIKMIVPFSPGGGVDMMARFLATSSEKYFGVPMIVENVPGGSALIGAAQVAKAKPDGYTILANTNAAYAVAPHMYTVDYDPVNAFIPLLKQGNTPMLFVAGPASPAKTFEDFVKYAKANPGKVTVGCAGLGDTSGIQVSYAFKVMGLKVRLIPFRGAAETTANVLGGHVMYGNVSDSPAVPHLASGKLKAFFEFGGEPGKFLKDIPTLDKLGYPGASSPYYRVISAPSGTPKEIVDILREGLLKMANDPDVIAMFDKAKIPSEGWSNDTTAIQKLMKEDYDKYGILVQELGISKK